MGIFTYIIAILLSLVLSCLLLITVHHITTGGITLELDEMYSSINEMACAAYEELKKQGRQCEIIEIGKGYPKFLIDGRKYFMMPRMTSVYGVPMQVVQFKMCRE